MANEEWMVPFVALASLDKPSRDRATEPLVLTMLPGPVAQKTAIAAVAVTQQAQDSVRQERRVAQQTVEAVGSALDEPDKFDLTTLTNLPALKAIASPDLVTQIKAVQASAVDQAVVNEAVTAITTVTASNGKKIPKADIPNYPLLTAHLSDDQKSAIFAQ